MSWFWTKIICWWFLLSLYNLYVDGGKKEGDVLGGDYFATLSVALSLPVVISDEYTMDIRSKLFFDVGNIWNKDQGILILYWDKK